MIYNLKPFSDYKESNFEWLGRIPTHWQIKPFRTILEEVKVTNQIDEEMLSVTISKGVIPQTELISDTSKKDSSNVDKTKYKLVLPGEIVYNKMRAWQGAIGVSNYRGIVSPAYIIHRLRKDGIPKYFHYLLRTAMFKKEAERFSYGITSDQWSLRSEHFKLIYGCIPPLEEQQAIVRFLDYTNQRIRKYIRNKQKLIKLLEEQKQAIIHQAVTRGLDPNSPLKDSGVDWLGEIPVNWEVRKIKFIARVNPKTEKNGAKEKDKIEFLPMENVDETTGTIKKFELRPFIEVSKGYTTFASNDVIFAKITPCMENGNCVIVPALEFGFGFGSTEFIVFRAINELSDKNFLHLVLRNKKLRLVCEQFMKGSAGQKRISPDFLANLEIAVPPNIEEQKAIVEKFEIISTGYDKAISKVHEEINVLREFLSKLTADIVRGKLDIRQIVDSLPVIIDEDILEEDLNDSEEDLSGIEIEEEI